MDGYRRTTDAKALPVDGGIDARDSAGMTRLMHGACAGAAGLVKDLLAAGARVDVFNVDGNQALWMACVSDDPATVSLLVGAGADLDHANKSGVTALMYAASAGKEQALARLLASGADLDIEADGLTALDLAASEACLRLLLRAKWVRRAVSAGN